MSNSDPRFERSRAALLEGMTALLDGRPLGEISVTELVARSGVSRPTFYQHFGGGLSELASIAAVERLRSAFPLDPAAPTQGAVQLRRAIEPIVSALIAHLVQHREFYLRVMGGAPTLELQGAVIDMMQAQLGLISPVRDSVDLTTPRMTIVHAGVVWYLMSWLSSPSEERAAADVIVTRLVEVLVDALELTRRESL